HEDFQEMIAYHAPDDIDRPLFGVGTRRERLINLIIGIVTSLCVLATLISAFIFPQNNQVHALHIYFATCIVLVCMNLLTLIYWYRQGDVDPKFRRMIYFNACCIILLCVSANLYFHCTVSTCNNANNT
uniref:Transmembrane protein 243 n=1 Tax=Ciona savignyi TaxID=51511 RepID=H2ZQE2_CIOSA